MYDVVDDWGPFNTSPQKRHLALSLLIFSKKLQITDLGAMSLRVWL